VPTVVDQAIVIRTWDFSETSQTASLLLREHGLIRGLAKGSRRAKSPFAPGLEVLTRGEIVAIVKTGTDLANLTDWDLQEVFWAPRRDLGAHRAGLYMIDLVHHALTDHDPHPGLFDALVRELREMEQPGRLGQALLRFQWTLLVETGYRPRLEADPPSRGQRAGPSAYTFSAEAGGLIADDRVPEAVLKQPGRWRVRADTVALLRRLERGEELHGDSVVTTIDRANRLLATYLRFIIARDIPSQSAVFGSL